MLLLAPGSPPPTRAGGGVISRCIGEDAGLCPHGAHTPTPRRGRLKEPLLRAAVMTTPSPRSSHPSPRTRSATQGLMEAIMCKDSTEITLSRYFVINDPKAFPKHQGRMVGKTKTQLEHARDEDARRWLLPAEANGHVGTERLLGGPGLTKPALRPRRPHPRPQSTGFL